MTTLMQASNQWATRPSDERFTNLNDMLTFKNLIRSQSIGKVLSTKGVRFAAAEPENPASELIVIDQPAHKPMLPSNWSFQQLASLAKAPAGYLRTLPAALVADALNYGMHFNRDVEDMGLLSVQTSEKQHRLAAATGPRYGRVWDADIIKALVGKFGDGVTGDWRVPGEFGKRVTVTKENTTLFAGDRDMFVFLADEDHRIEIPNRRNGQNGSLARGFFLWNSEVGSTTVGAAFFLFDYVCCNRIVWGAEGFKEIRLRHTASAPDKWLSEISPVLVEYANAATSGVVDVVKAAQNHKLDEAKEWLTNRFNAQQATRFMAAHEREENRPIENLWDVSVGMTAVARNIEWQDQRVALEREAGKVLQLAA